MDGKAGINFVLIIVAILFIVAGLAFCILFGINQTIPGRDYNVAVNLYIGLAGIALGVIMLIGCNIATNARITADNTNEILWRVQLLGKKAGIDMEGIAEEISRNKVKKAGKEARMVAKLRKQQQQESERQAALVAAGTAETAQAAAQADAATEAPATESAEVAADNTASAPSETEVATPDTAASANSGIDYAVWKSKLEGLVKCGTCGSAVRVRNSAKKGVVLVCSNNVVEGGSCKETPLPVDSMAEQFVAWYNGAYDGNLTEFDMGLFESTVASMTITDTTVRFVGK